jgi:ubiquinone/menaquinone biosynthesis C-methylase UbiE
MKTNAFTKPTPEINRILRDAGIRTHIEKSLERVLENLGVKKTGKHAKELTQIGLESKGYEYEARAHDWLSGYDLLESMQARQDIIFDQVKGYVKGPKVLDLGCGSGTIGKYLSEEHDVTLADVYRDTKMDSIDLPFVQFVQGENVPLEDEFDTTLLLTVLHHSIDPEKTLKEAKRLTRAGGRIVILESVYGIPDDIQEMNAYTNKEITDRFKRLTTEEQRLVTAYFDHLFNRIIDYTPNPMLKVSCPYNFNTPDGWAEILKKLDIKETVREYLGVDQPLAEIYHTIHTGQR